jgi:ribosome-binding ATPase YchF (GTP1/OBG family)
MKIGLVGLPKSGKTTLFNLLTGSSVATSRYDAGRSEMHTGIARVPDPRVDRLSGLFKPKKTTYATFEVVDLAGIEKGERTALDAKEFRNADALLHVVRAFADEARGAPDPRRDILDLDLELIFADLEVVDRRVERLDVSIKKQRKDAEVQEHAVLSRLKTALEAETPLRAMALTVDEVRLLRGFTFLSQKPILHLVNVEEAGIAQAEKVAERYGLADVAARPHTRVGWVSAVIEAEIAQLAGDEQQAFLADLGLTEPRSTGSCASASPCWGWSRSSRRGRTRCEPGPSRPVLAPRTRPAPCTPTSPGASSGPRSTATTSWWRWRARSPTCALAGSCGSRARTTSCATGRSATFDSTSRSSWHGPC